MKRISREFRYSRLFLSILFIWLFALLEIQSGLVFGWKPSFVLSALVTLVFFSKPFELLVYALWAVFLLRASPALGADILAVFFIPFGGYFLHILFRKRRWGGAVLFVIGGVFVFYALHGPSFLAREISLVASDIVASAVFGLVFFLILSYCDRERFMY